MGCSEDNPCMYIRRGTATFKTNCSAGKCDDCCFDDCSW